MDDVQPVIRAWCEADIPAVRQVLWDTWMATYSSFIPEQDLTSYFDEHYSHGALLRLMRSPFVRGFVAEVGGEPAAMMRTEYNAAEGRLYVSSLYVLSAYQSRGIGGRLLREAEALARRYGVDALWLGVMEQNVAALEWYRRIGFRFTIREPFTMGATAVMHVIGFRPLTTG